MVQVATRIYKDGSTKLGDEVHQKIKKKSGGYLMVLLVIHF